MVAVENCIASMPLGSVDGESGMLRSLESLLICQWWSVQQHVGDVRVATRSSGLPVGGAKYNPDWASSSYPSASHVIFSSTADAQLYRTRAPPLALPASGTPD